MMAHKERLTVWANAYTAALTGLLSKKIHDMDSGLIPKNWTVEKCSSAQVKGAEGNEEKSVQ